jgi:hypothetical protein
MLFVAFGSFESAGLLVQPTIPPCLDEPERSYFGESYPDLPGLFRGQDGGWLGWIVMCKHEYDANQAGQEADFERIVDFI